MSLRLGCVAVLLAFGCNGRTMSEPVCNCAGFDAPPVDAPPHTPCDPFAPNCEPGQKCTWVIDDPQTGSGHVGCVPDGTVSPGGSCTRGAPPPPGVGYDNCKTGSYCVVPAAGGSGTCTLICAVAGGPPACGSGEACASDGSAFATSPGVGLCSP